MSQNMYARVCGGSCTVAELAAVIAWDRDRHPSDLDLYELNDQMNATEKASQKTLEEVTGI